MITYLLYRHLHICAGNRMFPYVLCSFICICIKCNFYEIRVSACVYSSIAHTLKEVCSFGLSLQSSVFAINSFQYFITGHIQFLCEFWLFIISHKICKEKVSVVVIVWNVYIVSVRSSGHELHKWRAEHRRPNRRTLQCSHHCTRWGRGGRRHKVSPANVFLVGNPAAGCPSWL